MLSSEFYSLGGYRHLLLKYLHSLERWKQRWIEKVDNTLQLSTLNASCISPKHRIFFDSRSLCFKLLIPWDVAGVSV